MKIEIRLAVSTDAADMAEVLMRSWEVAYKDIIPAEYINAKNATCPEQYKRNISNDNADSYVIQLSGRTVGIMRIASPQDHDLGDDCYELHYIYLHPDYFRSGIGTQAMEYAFDKAGCLGKKAMIVWVLAENINAINFYKKCGFFADGITAMRDIGNSL